MRAPFDTEAARSCTLILQFNYPSKDNLDKVALQLHYYLIHHCDSHSRESCG
jgi:hypothetical protein